MVTRRRMSHDERRLQLLDTAAAMAGTEGAGALTLARVAERAGVTKPVVYEHFETRTGLLTALYHRMDDLQVQSARAALDARADSLEEAVAVLAEAYVDCALNAGREFGTVTAALGSIAGTETLLRTARERYAAIVLDAFERFGPAGEDDSRPVMLGVVGACEVLAREVADGRLDRASAIRAISRIMLGTSAGPPPRPRSA
ncbi:MULTISPECIES: TetR/AcrR family transcriptional regulator [unclassified Streptomyces]|uniref:TetR/AcrR family transcriptional regulator n=1 Tax=unclassified Streptomyces TaxID=2593676 RepID=UPI0038226AE0